MPQLRLTSQYDVMEEADPLAPIPFPADGVTIDATDPWSSTDSSREALRLASELEDAIDALQVELDRVSETLESALPFPGRDDGARDWPPPAA